MNIKDFNLGDFTVSFEALDSRNPSSMNHLNVLNLLDFNSSNSLD